MAKARDPRRCVGVRGEGGCEGVGCSGFGWGGGGGATIPKAT